MPKPRKVQVFVDASPYYHCVQPEFAQNMFAELFFVA